MHRYEMGLVETDDELRSCFPIIHQLRPHLRTPDAFVAQVRRQAASGYLLLAAWRRDQPIALAGYRIVENLLYGRFLYVDDLVSSEGARGQGVGGDLIAELREEGRRQACHFLVLDTALSNDLGQRFYFRQGLLARGMHFAQPL
ncbi:Acetyltransferase (GNAT) family protein [Luteibacter sp. UNC138MFCol5.1]|uniref:GNAT family N-acetyltransferase n=1 Tax=Luteibacter sp. UNC138MFCol5.1 TaxID=1502774 RepID=UPI0008D70E1D|nr:GNAT family N-acetyltransferase [Luteibacter sp. UNC138MFCol5.1]SEO92331.1 Acetyltransferase (GNAT) family protein [Luteibacter sp. UNC138MFCol5.1]